MLKNFGHEDSIKAIDLRQNLDSFYSQTQDYTPFHEANLKPEFWQPIKNKDYIYQPQVFIVNSRKISFFFL